MTATSTGDSGMATKTERIAQLIKSLTYDEMMEIAGWFSGWTGIYEIGEDQPPTIDCATMAANLSDWADNILGGDE